MIVIVFLASAAAMVVFKLITDQFLGTTDVSWGDYGITIAFVGLVSSLSAFFWGRNAVNKITLDSNPHAVSLVLKAVNHMVGNLMNQFQFVRQKIEEDGGMSEESGKLMDDAVEEAQFGLTVLNNLEDTADESNYRDIYPQ